MSTKQRCSLFGSMRFGGFTVLLLLYMKDDENSVKYAERSEKNICRIKFEGEFKKK